MVDRVIAQAQQEAPNECCGMIGAVGGEARSLYPATNAEASPLRYSIDPKDQFRIMASIEQRGEELGAIYHSHTRSPAYPSQTDVNLAFYPDAIYIIVSIAGDQPEVRAFTIKDGVVGDSELQVGG
jgi:[CysO sulfur-carrier protein]-S-L-cysteine hydrolase